MDWTIRSEGYDDREFTENGNKFFCGNGFIGVRGTLEEAGREEQPAVNLAGVYDRAEGAAWREPVNAPNGFYAALAGTSPVREHFQSLDFQYGIHSRRTVFESCTLTIERFVSMADTHLLCQRITVEPRNGCVRFITGIDCDVWDLNGTHLVDYGMAADESLSVKAVTYERRIPVSVCESFSVVSGIVSGCSADINERGIFRAFDITGRTVIERAISVWAGEIGEHAHVGYGEALAAHKAVWDGLWERSLVRILGDSDAETALNYSLYHLHSIAPRHTGGLSIPARGLSGQTYRGAIFWDTEIFLMPFFTLTEPRLARELLRYRIDTLGGALKKAEEYGFRGAFYPWESQNGGIEGCGDFNVTDVFTGRPVRTFFRDKQIHISGDIVYALMKYIDETNDTAILDEGGNAVIKAVAEFYESRAYRRCGSDVLEFSDVVGPDEYHERVDNNAYTNAIAQFALDAFKAGVYTVKRPNAVNGITEQFDGYFKMEDAPLSEVRARLKNPREYWGTQSGIAFATQIIKQADVLTLMNLFPDNFTDEDVRRNWEYYEPRTEHGSSLSACMYALAACRIGRADLAYPLFMKSAKADLSGGGKSWAGDMYIGGTHPAAAGGAWLIAARGFAGLRTAGDEISFKPCLPQSFEGIELPFIYRGKRHYARVSHNKTILEDL